MDIRDVRRGFVDAARKVTSHVHVQEELIEETDAVRERAYKRKYHTYAIVSGERYVGRRPRK